jgi:SNF2-related domain/Helicase conserved C-terminal domain
MTTKPSRKLTLRDRLSHLNYVRAAQLLGPIGKKVIQEGAKYREIDVNEQVRLTRDRFELTLPFAGPNREDVVATIDHADDARGKLRFGCSVCQGNCEHVGAAVSLVLEEKLALGLAAEPTERTPAESLSEEELVQQALADRAERARKEKFRLESDDPKQPWTDYVLTSAGSGKSYRLALRGEERGESYCSCPDFRTNTLGTCKHVIYALDRVRRKFPEAKRKKRYRNRDIFVHVLYGEDQTLHLRLPDKAPQDVADVAGSFADKPIADVEKLIKCIGRLENAGHAVTIYPDAEELIDRRLFQKRIADLVADIRRHPAKHPLRTSLLKTELLPYQMDGIAFAVGAGRAILADDMGLGKTIQGIGVAELLAREANISRVLIVCPASLKSQWRNEIRRFTDRDAQLIAGRNDERAGQYQNDELFTVCNYEQVLRDLAAVEEVSWDLIILDEGQRIKNWEAKTSRVLKGLKSTFALVLSGTPLENRLDDLYSVVQFIDDRRLGPAFRFFNRHRVVDEKGKVLGYKNLDELRNNLGPVLLRRTRSSVLTELPPRTTEYIRIPPTEEQLDLHGGHMRMVSMITRKAFISEMDLLRLQKALLMCRMSADSTYLVDKKEPAYSSKLEHMRDLLRDLLDEPDRKAVLFSEWTTMLDLIEPLTNGHRYVRLDGSVPQKKRQALVHEFQNDEQCRLFLTTNAGSTGLNLQSANTVINVDLPWNPAVLEQRIARAHRMGQRQPVQVFVLITEQTIEENLLATLSAKQDLSMAALDFDSTVNEVQFPSGMEELRRRLEVLLGAKPEAAVDESRRQRVNAEVDRRTEHRERVAAAGGELLGAAFRFLDQLVTQAPLAAGPPVGADDRVANRLLGQLSQCTETDADGRPRLTVTLPDREALNNLAQTMARLLAIGQTDDAP